MGSHLVRGSGTRFFTWPLVLAAATGVLSTFPGNCPPELRARRWGASIFPWLQAGASEALGRQNEGFLGVVLSEQVSGGRRLWNQRDQSVLEQMSWTCIPAQQPAAGASSSCVWEVSLEGIGPRRGRFVGLTKDP